MCVWMRRELRISFAALTSQNVRAAVMLEPVISATVPNSLSSERQNVVTSYRAKTVQATSTATEEVMMMMAVNFPRREKLRRGCISAFSGGGGVTHYFCQG